MLHHQFKFGSQQELVHILDLALHCTEYRVVKSLSDEEPLNSGCQYLSWSVLDKSSVESLPATRKLRVVFATYTIFHWWLMDGN